MSSDSIHELLGVKKDDHLFTGMWKQFVSLLLPAADVKFEEPEVDINKAAEWKLN